MAKVWKLPPLPPKPAFKAPTVDFVSAGSSGEVVRSVGAKSLQENLLLLPKAAMEAAVREMTVIQHEVIVDAQENYVPIDKGDLKDSGDSDSYDPGKAQTIEKVACWFGGEPTVEQLAHGAKDVRAYALEQHENMELHHPPLRDRHRGIEPGMYHRPGGPKYLERPFNERVPTVNPRIAAAVASSLSMNTAFVQMALTEAGGVTAVDPNLGKTGGT